MQSDPTLPIISLILSSIVLYFQLKQCPEDLKRRIKKWFKRPLKRPDMTRAEGIEEFKKYVDDLNPLKRPDDCNDGN